VAGRESKTYIGGRKCVCMCVSECGREGEEEEDIDGGYKVCV
jgi:hypothetical protein